MELCREKTFECKGVREKPNCYRFQPTDDFTAKDFYRTFPIIKFVTPEGVEIKWFPSEYFYQETPGLYCLTVDPFGSDGSMVIGGSMMRQNMYIFDITNNKVGIVRSRCSEDPTMYIHDDPKYDSYTPAQEVSMQNRTEEVPQEEPQSGETQTGETQPGEEQQGGENQSSTESKPASKPEPSEEHKPAPPPVNETKPVEAGHKPTVEDNWRNSTNNTSTSVTNSPGACVNCHEPPKHTFRFIIFVTVV